VAEVVVFNNPIPQNTGDKEMTQHADIYERITAAIIEAIEAGCGKFEMPWHTFGVMPSNANTHRRYRGINTLVLWAAAAKHGYKTNLWATYQQWSELGAQVRKGAKSTTVVFWKFYGEEREADDTSAEESKDETRSRCFARAYSVFNADQVDGFIMPEVPQLPEAERIERAEQFFRQTGIKIIEKGGRACYNIATDEIHMPPFSLFKKSDYFYSTLSHEACMPADIRHVATANWRTASVLKRMQPRSCVRSSGVHFYRQNWNSKQNRGTTTLLMWQIGSQF
jgi:antirestriction protein ArdC